MCIFCLRRAALTLQHLLQIFFIDLLINEKCNCGVFRRGHHHTLTSFTLFAALKFEVAGWN